MTLVRVDEIITTVAFTFVLNEKLTIVFYLHNSVLLALATWIPYNIQGYSK
jgi:hypothetical protein